MAYTKLGRPESFGTRSDDMLTKGMYDTNAPGLYPDEQVVQIGDDYIAISVEPKWQSNGTGVTLHAWARWLMADGSTQVSPTDGSLVEVQFPASFCNEWLSVHSQSDLASEMIRVMLGEDQTMIPLDTSNPLPMPQAGWPTGVTVDTTLTECPLLGLPDEALATVRITDAIKHCKDMASIQLTI